MSSENLRPDGEAPDPNWEGTIQVYRTVEHIRMRPGMYSGDTGVLGLHHLLHELVANAVDEARAGFCTEIHLELLADGGCRVRDNGRGIPVAYFPPAGKRAIELVFTTFVPPEI